MASRPAFALLHGGGQGSWVWEETAGLLEAAGAQVVALDVPGCGTKRGRAVETLDTNAVVAELIGDLRTTGLRNVILVGHSLAGALMPRMAAHSPGLFKRLVYVACSAAAPGQSFAGMIGSGLHGERDDEVGWPLDPKTHAPEARYRAMFCNDMSDAEADAFLARLGEDMWPMDVLTRTDHRYDHLGKLPSTFILCERDQSLPAMWQERFAERLQVDRIVRLDAGHQAMTTQPEKLAELLLAETR